MPLIYDETMSFVGLGLCFGESVDVPRLVFMGSFFEMSDCDLGLGPSGSVVTRF
jgi:hypothetical protein